MQFYKSYSNLKKFFKSRKLKYIIIVSVITIVLYTLLDDDLLLYYKTREPPSSGENIEYNKDTYIITKEEKELLMKTGNSNNFETNEFGGMDVDLDNIHRALQEIIGNLSDEYIKGDTNMFDYQIEFFREVLPYAILVHVRNPYMYASTALLQRTCESGWYSTTPVDSVTGVVSNNFFGIKSSGGKPNEFWSGDYIETMTKESADSGSYFISDKFRKYSSPMNSFLDWGVRFFEDNTRYRGDSSCSSLFGLTGDKADYRNATSGLDQVKIIQNAGYSPGSENSYMAMATSNYNGLKMKRFDDLAEQVVSLLQREQQDKYYEGEWNPTKLTIFNEAGLNPDDLDDAQQAIIMEAMSLRGMVYAWGGQLGRITGLSTSKVISGGIGEHTFPHYSTLSYNDGVAGTDCSGYICHIYQHCFGLPVMGNTSGIYHSGFLDTVGINDGQPGDIMGNEDRHVVLILKNNGNGTYKIIHEPQSQMGSELGHVSIIDDYTPRSGMIIRRLKNRSTAEITQSGFTRITSKENTVMKDMKEDERFQNDITRAKDSLGFTPKSSKHVKITVTLYTNAGGINGGDYDMASNLLTDIGEPCVAMPSKTGWGSYVILDEPVTLEYSLVPDKDIKTAIKFKVVDSGGAIKWLDEEKTHCKMDIFVPNQTEEKLRKSSKALFTTSGTIYYK